MNVWRLSVAGLILLATYASSSLAANTSQVGAGESIYLGGILSSGAPLEGAREGAGITTKGADVACVNCHQHSGLGSQEGNISIPPVTGEYLFHSRGHDANEPMLP
jgi:hypothetical protein